MDALATKQFEELKKDQKEGILRSLRSTDTELGNLSFTTNLD
jgi:hypothetical protein